MIKKTLFVSMLALTLSIAGSQTFAKGSKAKGDSKKSEPKPEAAPAAAPAPAAAAAPAAAPAPSGGGMGTAVAAGVGGAVIGGLAGAAIASSMSGDGDKATTSTSTATPSPLLKMTPEDAVKSATEMQLKASEAGFGFSKSDEMLRKAGELMAKDDAGKKQAQEIAVIVHTWAEAGVKQADELKKVADKLGL